MPYPIVDISDWRVLSVEEMGSKPKFWVQQPEGPKWLFKHRHRPYVGDDWAEKIAAEVAETLGIPHATVELARFADMPGIISKDLVGTDPPRELVLGNSLLEERANRLTTRDRGYSVAAFAARARSALYRVQGDPRPMSPIDAFREAEKRRPDAGTFWRDRLRSLDADRLEEVVLQAPGEVMSQTSMKFALALMACNRSILSAETR